MLRFAALAGWLVAVSLFCATAWAGEIGGHIVITRNLTKKRVTLPPYQLRGVPLPARPEKPISIDEFSRVAVYLEGPPLVPEGQTGATLTQKDQQFDPEILIIPVGSAVVFPNADPIFHNVFSLSKAKQFDLGYYPAGQSRTVKFNKVGVVQVYCHIHPDMNATILVAPNMWYTRPKQDGTFTLSNIPAGTHQVVVWHKSVGFFRKSIQVPETGSVEVSMVIPLTEKE